MIVDHIIYAAAWFSFGLFHSLLASETAKEKLGRLAGPYYRLSYNLFAAFYISAVLAIGRLYMQPMPYSFSVPVEHILAVIQILGLGVMVWGASGYDLGLFAGTRQIRNHQHEPQDERLVIDGLHRYMRHPIYSGALLFLWGGIDSETSLATAVWGSAYILIGTYFEERKLLASYGEAYAGYRRKTPAFIPWKGSA